VEIVKEIDNCFGFWIFRKGLTSPRSSLSTHRNVWSQRS